MPWLNELALRCRQCIDAGGGAAQIRDLTAKALSEQTAVPAQTDVDRIVYRADDLLVASLAQPPFGNTPIHTHGIWCVIGVAVGREDNAFFERGPSGLVETHRVRLEAGECIALEPNVIHKIRNPDGVQSQVLHIYGGDLLTARRTMWNPHTAQELPLDQAQFEAWCEELTGLASKPAEAGALAW
jgi:predicted metal-dependent enzyme (double-stranded beta helix superfamily)